MTVNELNSCLEPGLVVIVDSVTTGVACSKTKCSRLPVNIRSCGMNSPGKPWTHSVSGQRPTAQPLSQVPEDQSFAFWFVRQNISGDFNESRMIRAGTPDGTNPSDHIGPHRTTMSIRCFTNLGSTTRLHRHLDVVWLRRLLGDRGWRMRATCLAGQRRLADR